MKIECILKREGGTHAEIGGVDYHFKPLPDGAHVAEVTDKEHIKRFLSIAEAYAPYLPGEEAPAQGIQEEASEEHEEDRAALVSQYEAAFGKPPHHKMKAETIKAKLAELQPTE